MRLLALERVDHITTVVYRWLDEPLTTARILLKTSADLGAIRAKLEQQYFSGEFTPDEFHIVVNEYAPPDLETAFAGFTITRLPGIAIADLIYAAVPLDITRIEELLSTEIAPHATDPNQAHIDLTQIMHSPVILTGFSRVAVAAVRALPDLPFELETISPRNTSVSTQPIIIAIGSDPGLSREEAQLMEHSPTPALLVMDIDQDTEKFKATLNFITRQINIQPINSDYQANLSGWYNKVIQDRLLGWLNKVAESETAIIQNAMKILKYSIISL